MITLPARALVLPLLLAVLPGFLAAQAEEDAPRAGDAPDIVGTVVDADTREPLEGVAVTLHWSPEDADSLGRSRMVVTNPQGRFAFRGVRNGRYRIRLERLGYGPLVESISFRAALGLRIEAELVPEAVELDPLLVAVEARSRHLESRGFYDRQTRGIGRFVTRDDIEERNPVRVTDMLMMMPGVQLRYGSGMGSETLVLMRGGCVAQVYIDGVRTITPFGLDTHLHPEDVSAMEVYHAAELPPQYSTTGCGAVLVWTRLPDADELGSPFTWGRMLTALGFVATAVLLVR